MRPLLAKALRIEFASLVSSPKLLIAEIDSYDTVAQSVEKAMSARTDGRAQGLDISDYQLGLELTKLQLQADLGLLEDFDRQQTFLLDGDDSTEDEPC